jgi:hypothetical protein
MNGLQNGKCKLQNAKWGKCEPPQFCNLHFAMAVLQFVPLRWMTTCVARMLETEVEVSP